MEKNYKPWLATALSFVFAGLGHLYVGSYLKGVVFFVLDAFLIYVMLTYAGTEWIQVLSAVVSIAVSYDAYNLALAKDGKEKRINHEPKEQKIEKELRIY